MNSLLLSISLLGLARRARGAQSVAATDALVAWTGRFAALPDGASVACDWASTAATLAIAGGAAGDATLTVRTAATFEPAYAGRLDVYINYFHATSVLVPAGAHAFLVAAALPANAVSNVSLVFNMEAVLSHASPGAVMVFSGFDVGGGGSLVAPPRQQRRIDVIGDSISAGADYDRMESVTKPGSGAFSLGGHCAPWCPLYGYSQSGTWESWLGRFFDANMTTTAWSGKQVP